MSKNEFLQNFKFSHVTKEVGLYHSWIALDIITKGFIKDEKIEKNKIEKSRAEFPYLGKLLYVSEWKVFVM